MYCRCMLINVTSILKQPLRIDMNIYSNADARRNSNTCDTTENTTYPVFLSGLWDFHFLNESVGCLFLSYGQSSSQTSSLMLLLQEQAMSSGAGLCWHCQTSQECSTHLAWLLIILLNKALIEACRRCKQIISNVFSHLGSRSEWVKV